MSENESATQDTNQAIHLGLLGEEARFDGGHKRDAYVNGTHGREMAGRLRDISGYILKRAAPSCGMERVKVHSERGMPTKNGAGAYAEAFMAAQPLLPYEEEGRLGDAVLRENFIVRVYVYHRWQRLVSEGLTPGRLVEFHIDHKYRLLAHSQSAYRRMGRLVAEAGAVPVAELGDRYVVKLISALKQRAGRKQHVNVLQHLLGYVGDRLDADDRAEMVEVIEQYRPVWCR